MKFTLLQWNIWYREEVSKVIKVLRELSPDVICLQELSCKTESGKSFDSAETIKRELKLNAHVAKAQTWIGGHQDSQGNGIFSTHSISRQSVQFVRSPHDAHIVDYSHEGRVYLECTVAIEGCDIRVGTTHMSYAHKFEPSIERLEEDEKLLEFVRDKERYLFAADLNTHPRSKLINSLSKQFSHAGPGMNVNTWTTKPFDYNDFKESELNWRLDYVFATRDVKVISAQAIKTDVSDHLPILVEVEIAEARVKIS